MTIVRHFFFNSQGLNGFGFMNEGHLACFPKTIAFKTKCFNCDKQHMETE